MAKDIYDKLKAIGELFKQYWKIGVMIGFISISGNIYQAMTTKTETVTEPEVVTKPKPKSETVIIREDCVDCMEKLDAHIKEYKKNMKLYHR